MRVLFLVEGGDHPGGDDPELYGGYVRYIANAVEELGRHGAEVIFGTTRGRTPLHPVVEDLGIETFALGCRSRLGYPVAVLRLARLIRRYRPDVLHLNEPIQGVIGGAAGLLAGRAVRIFHRHHLKVHGPMTRFSAVASRLCHMTMVVSNAVRTRAVEEENIRRSRVCVAWNGIPEPRDVPDAEVEELRRHLSIPVSAPVVVMVGHLNNPTKGHESLIAACNRAADELGDSIHLVVVGAGPRRGEVEKQVAAADRVTAHLVGHATDVYVWYRLADVVAVPSRDESFGLVATEGLATGSVVVASAVGGLAEQIVHGKSGLLVEPGSVSSLTEALVHVLSNDEFAAAMRVNARARYLSEFTTSAMVERWLGCYRRAQASTRSARPGDA